MTPLLRKILGLSWLQVIVMFGLLILGVFTIESAARHLPSGGKAIADKQVQWIFIGAVIYFTTALIDYKWIKYLALPMYIGALILMIIALKWGNKVHQIELPGVSFQPAQFAVVAGFVMMAWLLQEMGKWHPLLNLPLVRVAVISLVVMIPFSLVAMMGDMGSAIVWLPMVIIVMLVGGIPFRYLAMITSIGLAMIPILFYWLLPMVSERGSERIEIYLDMLNDRKVDIAGDAYGPYYVSMAVGTSGFKGKGYKADESKRSLHAMRYIPVKTAHNDYIFGVFAEEQGFRGTILLVLTFSMLLIQCVIVSYYSRDMSGQIISAAVVALFFAHIFENIGMCCLLMPVTGIPLPLISYSGTFVVMCMFMLGLVQSIWVHRRVETNDAEPANTISRRT